MRQQTPAQDFGLKKPAQVPPAGVRSTLTRRVGTHLEPTTGWGGVPSELDFALDLLSRTDLLLHMPWEDLSHPDPKDTWDDLMLDIRNYLERYLVRDK